MSDNPILDVLQEDDDVPTQANVAVPVQANDVTVIDRNLPITPPKVDWIDDRAPELVERDRNMQLAKNNIKDVMPTIADAASDTLAIAKMLSSADHAAAGSSLLGQYLAAQKALVAIEKAQDDMRHRDKKANPGEASPEGGQQVTNQTLNVFAGTTTELLEILDQMKKQGKV